MRTYTFGDHIYNEKMTGTKRSRPELEKMLDIGCICRNMLDENISNKLFIY